MAPSHTLTSQGNYFDYTSTTLSIGFGARYYDSDISIWLSVDPLADKYPSTSPFMYVRGNPVMLIDRWGLEGGKPDKIKIRKVKSDRAGQSRFLFRNKTTKERGWIYTPEGKKTKDVKKDHKDGNFNNYDIYNYDKDGKLTNEEHYDSDGRTIKTIDGGNLSEIVITGKRTKGEGLGYSYNVKKLSDNQTRTLLNTNQSFLQYQSYALYGSGLSSIPIKNGPFVLANAIHSAENMMKSSQVENIEDAYEKDSSRSGVTVETWYMAPRGTYSFPMTIKYVTRNSDNKFLGIIWH